MIETGHPVSVAAPLVSPIVKSNAARPGIACSRNPERQIALGLQGGPEHALARQHLPARIAVGLAVGQQVTA